MQLKTYVSGLVILIGACAVAACSGGSTGPQTVPPIAFSSQTVSATPKPSPSPTVKPTPKPTPTPKVGTLSGTVADITSGAPLDGVTVTLGEEPAPATCLAKQTQTLNPCGVAAKIIATTKTTSTGAFTLPAEPNGSYMLTIGNPIVLSPTAANHATLHRWITLTGGANAYGTATLTSLDYGTVVVVLHNYNNDRLPWTTVPSSFANMTIDEYAQEQAAAAVAAQTSAGAVLTDAGTFSSTYAASPGAFYNVKGFGYSGTSATDYQNSVVVPLFAGNTYCSFWPTCTPPAGHLDFPAAASTRDVWMGMGLPAPGATSFYYSLIIVWNNFGTQPLDIRRTP